MGRSRSCRSWPSSQASRRGCWPTQILPLSRAVANQRPPRRSLSMAMIGSFGPTAKLAPWRPAPTLSLHVNRSAAACALTVEGVARSANVNAPGADSDESLLWRLAGGADEQAPSKLYDRYQGGM